MTTSTNDPSRCKICGLPLATAADGEMLEPDEEYPATLCWVGFGHNQCTGRVIGPLTPDEIVALDEYFKAHGVNASLECLATRVALVALRVKLDRRASSSA